MIKEKKIQRGLNPTHKTFWKTADTLILEGTTFRDFSFVPEMIGAGRNDGTGTLCYMLNAESLAGDSARTQITLLKAADTLISDGSTFRDFSFVPEMIGAGRNEGNGTFCYKLNAGPLQETRLRHNTDASFLSMTNSRT